MNTFQGGVVAVPILVDQLNDGNGNTGLSFANFAINYDSSKFTVPTAELYQGTAGVSVASLLPITSTAAPGQLLVSLGALSYPLASVVGTGGTSLVTVTTKNPLPVSLASGYSVEIVGLAGFPAIKGEYSINVTGANKFTLNNTNGIVGSSTVNSGNWAPVIAGGPAGTNFGASNDSLVMIDFHATAGAGTGTTSISLVSSNSLGSTFVFSANGNPYSLALTSGSANIMPKSSTPNLGFFNAVTPLNLTNGNHIGSMLLLANGDVMANVDLTTQWDLLTPDSAGNYNDGTWSSLADSNVGGNAFGSVVMQNGDVMVLGGENTNIGGPIASIVGTATTPITVTTVNPLPTDLKTGNAQLSNVTGFSSYNINQDFIIAVTGSNTFTLNGTVGIVGSSTPNTGTFYTNDTNIGEIFTPPTSAGGKGSWLPITTFPQGNFGDGSLELMSDGSVLAQYFGNGNSDPFDGYSYRYYPSLDPLITPGLSPDSRPWFPDAQLPGGLDNSETTWAKLPDGSILSYNIDGNGDASPQTATRLVFGATPAQDQWVPASNVNMPLGETGGEGVVQEIGPELLLPDGRMFQVGANGNTALYSPPSLAGNGTGTWQAGPVIPYGEGATDAPGAIMPNGDVLFAVSPYMINQVGDGFGSSITLDEYNPTTNTISIVPPNDLFGGTIADLQAKLAAHQCYNTRMMDLPNGQVLFNDSEGTMYVYSPNASPNGTATPLNSWRPVITNITAGSNGSLQITGTQLNGISEGSSFGDDVQNATNYPIVRIQNQNTSVVSYATSFGWSTAGVATGNTPETANFYLPSRDGAGADIVTVIANGIASTSALDIDMGGASGLVLIADSNPALLDVKLAGNATQTFNLASSTAPISQIIVSGSPDNQAVVVNYNFGGRPVNINTGDTSSSNANTVDIEQNGANTFIYGGVGNDTFDLGLGDANLSLISSVSIRSGGATSTLNAYDNSNSTASTYTVGTGFLVNLGAFDFISRSGFGGVFLYGTYQGLNLETGTGADTVNVTSTSTTAPVNLNSAGGNDSVNIGQNGLISSIAGAVKVSNTPAFTTITINDSADTASNDNFSITGTAVTNAGFAGVSWTPTDVNGVVIDGGTGTDGFAVFSGGSNYVTTMNFGGATGEADFEVNVAGSFQINGQGGTDTADIIDAFGATQTYTITSTSMSRAGLSVGLSNLGSVILNCGAGSNTVNIQSLPCALTVNGNSGNDTYNVTNASRLPSLAAGLVLNGGVGGAALTFDDSSDTFVTSPIISSTTVQANAGAAMYSSISTLTYDLPGNGNMVQLNSTNSITAYVINGGAGNDTLQIANGNLNNVVSDTIFNRGGITFNPGAGIDELYLDDAQSNTARTYNFVTQGLNIASQLNLAYAAGLESIQLDAGNANNTFSASGTELGCSLTINTGNGSNSAPVSGTSFMGPLSLKLGSGNNTVTVGVSAALQLDNSIGGIVTVTGNSGKDTLTVNDVDQYGYFITSTNVGDYFSTLQQNLVAYSKLASITLNTGANSGNPINVTSTASGTPVTINAGSGTTTINASQTSATGPVIIGPSSGTSTVNVSTTGLGAVVDFQATQQIGALTIGAAGMATIAGASPITLTASALSIAATATLDITTSTLKVNFQPGSDPVSTIRGYLLRAYAAAHWTGTGLTSTTVESQVASVKGTTNGSYSIGYSDGNNDGTIGGVKANQILITPELVADGNMDGKVDFNDLLILAQNNGSTTADWTHGDFNFDGKVDFNDLLLLAQNNNKTNGNTLLSTELPSATIVASAVGTPIAAMAQTPQQSGRQLQNNAKASQHVKSPKTFAFAPIANPLSVPSETGLFTDGNDTMFGVWKAPPSSTIRLFADGSFVNVLA